MNAKLLGVVLLAAAATASGADLGRMFFTPAQRAVLDNARKQNIRSEVGSDNERQAAPIPQNISVNGLVQRSDGKSTVWLNSRPLSENQASGVNVSTGKNDNRVKLTVPESGRSVDLKVGQTVEVVSGTIEEGYSRRAAPKPEAKASSDSENTASSVPKVTLPQASQAVKSDPIAQKKAARAAERDLPDDIRLNSGSESKK